LQERYKCPVGYSGHEYDLEASVFSALLGAQALERHVTIDHTMWGTDQAASLEVTGMDILRKRIEAIPVILGSEKKEITESEIAIRKKLRGN